MLENRIPQGPVDEEDLGRLAMEVYGKDNHLNIALEPTVGRSKSLLSRGNPE